MINTHARALRNSFSSAFLFIKAVNKQKHTLTPTKHTHTHSARQLRWTSAWRQAFRFYHGNQTSGIAAQKSLRQSSGKRNRLCCTVFYTIYPNFVCLCQLFFLALLLHPSNPSHIFLLSLLLLVFMHLLNLSGIWITIYYYTGSSKLIFFFFFCDYTEHLS